MKLKPHSFQTWVCMFLLAILLVDLSCIAGFLFLGNIFGKFDQNASDIFLEEVENRSNYLEHDMVQRWSQLEWTQSTVEDTVNAYLSEHALTAGALKAGSGAANELLEALTPDLISTMRRNSVSGVFLIFDGSNGAIQRQSGDAFKAGVYIRDTDPTSTPSSNSDLLLKCGPFELADSADLAMDIGWSPMVTVGRDSEWYWRSILAAQEYPDSDAEQLGYWASAHLLSGDRTPSVVTYTQPLRDKSGQVYGVLGIELTKDYLRRQLPSGELPGDEGGAYILAYADKNQEGAQEGEGTDSYGLMASSGTQVSWLFGEEDTFRISQKADRAGLCLAIPGESAAKSKVYSYVRELELYEENGPYEGECWYLVGLSRSSDLFAVATAVRRQTTVILVGILLFSIVLSLVAGTYFSRPINDLSTAVAFQDPDKPITFKATNIKEIDQLAKSITSLNLDVAEESSRMSRAIDLAGAPIAIFQFHEKRERFTYTSRFFSMLDKPEPEQPLTAEQVRRLLKELYSYADPELSDDKTLVLYMKDPLGEEEDDRWVQFQQVQERGCLLGVLVDITNARRELKRAEFERDHDLLTRLANRRAFNQQIDFLSKAKEEERGVCAVLMMDMDNLKSINDNYGHDYGDEYLRRAADVMHRYQSGRCFPARISGDEFYILFRGFSSREELEKEILQLRADLADATIHLPSGEARRLRASGGVAWYPYDTQRVEDLPHFADFAMYQAKHSEKGSLRHFDRRSYEQDSSIVYDSAELDRILDTAALDFKFQPIVSCQSGVIFGYEGLMVPRSDVFSSPEDLLQIARVQSKLHRIEVLTRMRCSASFLALEGREEGAKLFLNSIPSQILTEEEMDEYDSQFSQLADQMVIELTENDQSDEELTKEKVKRFQARGMQIALDDFGSGYSNESRLLSLHPHFVKVDISVIRDLDTDPNRQIVFRNLTATCHEMGVLVIAEGVETAGQLRTAIALGADYLQGYYLGRPCPVSKPIPENVQAEVRKAWWEFRGMVDEED